ncbi:MAG: DNA polymerase III subunit beta [Myxococcales bacterium]|nr:DNA polymerase III subunit beta [Myxococcales bacterium]MCB9629496.1 DNA polymerase III subunit beta [Sandaracinaceae bacterium]
MEFSISKRDFLRCLARTHAVADRKSSMPILSNILLATEGTDRVRLSATDLYLGVTSLSVADVKRAGSVAISARTLFDIVKNLPEGEVSFSVGPNHACEIRCGKVRYKIPGMADDDFPPLPVPENATFAELDATRLGELIGLTQYSMSHDDTRPHLSGTLLEIDGGKLRLVTTDGHRLSKAEHSTGVTLEFTMLVPHKGIAELKRMIEEARADLKGGEAVATVAVAKTKGHAFFVREGLSLSVKLADEQFPPYNKVIPKQQSKRVVASRARLVESLRRINLVANDKSGGVQLHLSPGLLRVQSQNPDVGEGVEELEVDYAGDPLSIGFNAKYLLEALNALSHDEVALELNGEVDPGVIKPVGDGADFVGVVMPMRI